MLELQNFCWHKRDICTLLTFRRDDTAHTINNFKLGSNGRNKYNVSLTHSSQVNGEKNYLRLAARALYTAADHFSHQPSNRRQD